MCGRYALAKETDETSEYFGIVEVQDPVPHMRYNIAPGQHVPAVMGRKSSEDRVLKPVQWGLVPSWVRDFEESNQPINARSETAATKPYFRKAMKVRRCILPATGFYEWAKEGNRKQPHYLQLTGVSLFGLAGIWEHWEGADGSIIQTCAILTCRPNPLVSRIHNRMPVILKPDSYGRWLDPAIQDSTLLNDLMVPYPESGMDSYPVSRFVNSPDHDSPDCLTPLPGSSSQPNLL